MTRMQTHLRMLTTSELSEFKRQITPNATQKLATTLRKKEKSTNPLSRETSPRANRTLTEFLPSRETSPHPNKSMKKLAQALKKRIKSEAEPQTNASKIDHSFKRFAKALKPPAQAPHPDPSMKKLAEALKRCSERKEQCAEYKNGYPTPVYMKRSEGLRK